MEVRFFINSVLGKSVLDKLNAKKMAVFWVVAPCNLAEV
jgi:hypothetical protein